jgi:hypothetical protein
MCVNEILLGMVNSIILMTTILKRETVYLIDSIAISELIHTENIITIPCDELVQLEVRTNYHFVDDSGVKVDEKLSHRNLRCWH